MQKMTIPHKGDHFFFAIYMQMIYYNNEKR